MLRSTNSTTQGRRTHLDAQQPADGAADVGEEHEEVVRELELGPEAREAHVHDGLVQRRPEVAAAPRVVVRATVGLAMPGAREEGRVWCSFGSSVGSVGAGEFSQ